MTRRLCFATAFAAALVAGCSSPTEIPPLPEPPPGLPTAQTIDRSGYSLVVTNLDPDFPAATLTRMVDCFFATYPQMAARFNPGARRSVSLTIDPNRTGVAFASGGGITVAAAWMKSHPNDIDVMTHEAFHVVQSYPAGRPSWIVEGLADYARDRYGVANATGGWSLPALAANHRYTDSYRITARFFKWLEINESSRLLEELDGALRSAPYDEAFWSQRTGRSLDELWAEYTRSPSL